mmetsp:Transcript_17218/g.33767  ORF Transcript_17218/g.33767 Transcript_17218/m.33767 type:complete len:596 (+) Transcript_17218:206-1993(+)|eukprot:CAMPEP_0171497196 /NCGR_PEP_ID=MMETSP0958-20121227/7131_1 /TAXON_ID=87120 /ORGANISM="Aurantiochytrium limacinum, Strain ATCCMYA-1381" /LENGTH=595 /DNA_ID=CAMNT_0012031399 /DNA_START=116 /DNA_END=1903 /DNA_ORIENTATION=+
MAGEGHGRSRSGPDGSNGTQTKNKKPEVKERSFVVDLRYRNDLPEPPCDPKFLKIPSQVESMFKYHFSSMERAYKHKIYLKPTLGPAVNLMDPRTAEIPGVPMHKADKHLLRKDTEDDVGLGNGTSGSGQVRRRIGNDMSMRNIQNSMAVRANKHWLRKTEYLDNNQFQTSHRVISQTQEIDQRRALLMQQMKKAEGNRTLKSKTERIEDQFASARTLPVHQTNPSLKPVRIFNIEPDIELNLQRLFHISFTDESALEDRPRAEKSKENGGQAIAQYTPEQRKVLSHALLEQLHTDAPEQISLIVPATEEDDKKMGVKRSALDLDDDDEDMDDLERSKSSGGEQKYRWVRDYQYDYRNGGTKFAFLWDRQAVDAPASAAKPVYGKVRFVELEPTFITLTRNQTDRFNTHLSRVKRIRLDRRELNDDEEKDRQERLDEMERGQYDVEDEIMAQEEAAAEAQAAAVSAMDDSQPDTSAPGTSSQDTSTRTKAAASKSNKRVAFAEPDDDDDEDDEDFGGDDSEGEAEMDDDNVQGTTREARRSAEKEDEKKKPASSAPATKKSAPKESSKGGDVSDDSDSSDSDSDSDSSSSSGSSD